MFPRQAAAQQGAVRERYMATFKMVLDTAAEAVTRFNQHGGFSIMLLLFALTLWVEGTVGMFSGLARAWARDTADALELARFFCIMRGYLARRRRGMVKRTIRLLQACDYAACRLYLNVVDRERRHQERIAKERMHHRRMVYMRVRHRITAPQRFAEQYFLDV